MVYLAFIFPNAGFKTLQVPKAVTRCKNSPNLDGNKQMLSQTLLKHPKPEKTAVNMSKNLPRTIQNVPKPA